MYWIGILKFSIFQYKMRIINTIHYNCPHQKKINQHNEEIVDLS